jgi:hypothetical protein
MRRHRGRFERGALAMVGLGRSLRTGPNVAGYRGAVAGASGPGAVEKAQGKLEQSALAMAGLGRLLRSGPSVAGYRGAVFVGRVDGGRNLG